MERRRSSPCGRGSRGVELYLGGAAGISGARLRLEDRGGWISGRWCAGVAWFGSVALMEGRTILVWSPVKAAWKVSMSHDVDFAPPGGG
eukprot:4554077-Prymnesium_polylepis.1